MLRLPGETRGQWYFVSVSGMNNVSTPHPPSSPPPDNSAFSVVLLNAACLSRCRDQLGTAPLLDGLPHEADEAGVAEGGDAAVQHQPAGLPIHKGRAGRQGITARVRAQAEGEAPHQGSFARLLLRCVLWHQDRPGGGRGVPEVFCFARPLTCVNCLPCLSRADHEFLSW